MESILACLAALVFLLHLLAEPAMRHGRARSLRTTPEDKGTTVLVSGLASVVVVGSILLRLLAPVVPPPVTPRNGPLLLALLCAGTGLRFWAMHSLGEFFTRTLIVHDDHRLVSSGPYAIIRHPGYLAQLLVLPSASALFSGSISVGATALLLLGAAYVRRIRSEEAMLAASLGDSYETYRRQTARLLPWLY